MIKKKKLELGITQQHVVEYIYRFRVGMHWDPSLDSSIPKANVKQETLSITRFKSL